MQANRAFMRRAVRHAVDAGIPTSLLDIGSGIPTFGNVHEVAQAADPKAKVAYVDHDPVAVAHSQAVLEGNDGTVIREKAYYRNDGTVLWTNLTVSLLRTPNGTPSTSSPSWRTPPNAACST
ncbi:hypothetical protein SCALM49S_09671 [Streptomyces californicus]